MAQSFNDGLHLPFCAFLWPSCSEATDASYVCGFIALHSAREEWSSAACDRLPKKLLSITGCAVESGYRKLGAIGNIRGGFPRCLFNVAEKSFYFALHEIGLHV